jgi:hypothetical protein
MQTQRWAVLGALAVTLIAAAPLHAQDSAAASALYDKGFAEMQAGKFATACPALAESYRLDPLPGALFTLADCEAKAGRLATAVARYDEYLAMFARMTPKEQTGQRGRDKLAAAAKVSLVPRVPTITLKLPASAPPGTQVMRDGLLLNTPALGMALPVDPGEHVITTQAPGGPKHEQRFTIGEGEKKEVDLEVVPPPAPEPSAAAPSQSAPVAPASSAIPVPKAPSSAADQRGPKQVPRGGSSHTGAWVFGGIGLAGIALGSVMGVMTLGKKSTVDKECKGTACSDAGMEAVEDGRTLGLVSTIGFGVGAAGVATAVILLLASSGGEKRSEARPRLQPIVGSPGHAGAVMGIRGCW